MLILKANNVDKAFELAQFRIGNIKDYTGNISDYKLTFVGETDGAKKRKKNNQLT